MDNKFTHLHVHSEYSLLDCSAKITELVKRTKELGMDSIALTDHGVMYGVIDFYKAAKDVGIKPILGCEVYVSSGSRLDKESKKDNFYYHLILLAENNEGYQNLIKLVSLGFTEGFYYKPRVDIEILKKYSKGLIALSACLGGPIAKTILKVSYEKALEKALVYNEIFGQGNFFIEIQDHGIKEQKLVNPQLIKISKETNIPLVCTNDTHYIYQEDSKAHDILLCIKTAKTINDEDRMRYFGDQFYIKSPKEMYDLFPYAKEALENTYEISKRCNVDIEFNTYRLPKFKLDEGQDAILYLENLCFEGLANRYENITEELRDRLNYELGVIKEMGFVDYFLIVWDFIKYAIDNSIIVGPGRGSAAGSIVAYCLRITDVDPIKYNLLFERFLNPERISMPDIDIDFCYERRQEVINYVIKKYGIEHVAQIVTFGTMAARGAIRDVGRALAIPYQTVDTIAKLVPFEIGITIKKALAMNSELKSYYDEDSDIKYLMDMSMKLEGLPRHSSTHAAGVVICNEPLTEYVPLHQNDGVVATQFTMNTLEELGLLKMDFLGLRTLTVIQNTLSEIKRIYDIDINFSKMEMDDSNVFELISQGKTEGVFQLESSGMKSFMKELQPRNLEDIIAGISLYRPGPMDFIPKYIAGKRNKDNIKYTHKALEPILNTTYGCIVYQEQVMQIVRDLGGYSLGRSDLIRRAMSKKKTSVMEEERKNFVFGLSDDVPGCIKNGIDQASAEKIFDEMTDFAKYAFNKSHAAAYAIIGYETAWLKFYYPVEFMAALMTSVMGAANTKVAEYIYECKKMNIKLLPPDINEGFGHFSVKDNSIRFGLSAIKNLGRPTIAGLVKDRQENGKFKSLTDFIHRMESRDLNKRGIESLIKAGAFDSLGGKRIQYMVVYKQILNEINSNNKKNIEGQMSLFELILTEEEIYKDELPEMVEYNIREALNMEKEVLGIYVTGHPLSEYESVLNKHINATSKDFILDENIESENEPTKIEDYQDVTVGGLITSKSIKYTKNNKIMAFITIEDIFGSIEVIIFPDVYDKYLGKLIEDSVVLVKGKASVKEDEDSKIICNKLIFFNELDEKPKPTLWLKIPKDVTLEKGELTDLLSMFPGDTPIIIYDEKNKKKFKADEQFWVSTDDIILFDRLKLILGEKSIVIKEN